ncbi:MAG: aldo/keto reductase [Cyclobacteriaceae bacterium]|jgi:aryl-alcohol dehydrogenase-like predicted oxidoreductase
MHRREFIKSSLLAGGVATMNPFPHALYASEKKKNANDIIKLGDTGIEVSRLAMGTGTHGVNRASNQTRKLGVKGLGELLHSAYDQGIFFWDSADQYGTHPHLKEALKYVPREKVVILTKTHATTEEEMKADLDRFRQEIGTDYLDIVLLHFMTKDNWPELKTGAMNVLSQAREDGIVRAHGVSCHTLGALKAAAATDWVQVDLARINPYGSRMDAEVPVVVDVLKDMKKKGKSIIGMKLFGAGELTDKLDECLQYTLGQDFVDCFTIGQEDRGQMEDLLTRIPAASTRG